MNGTIRAPDLSFPGREPPNESSLVGRLYLFLADRLGGGDGGVCVG